MPTSTHRVHIFYSRLMNKINFLWNQYCSPGLVRLVASIFIKPGSAKLKILWAPPIANYDVTFLHDLAVAEILRSRGHRIVPMVCDQVQKFECNVMGDKWLPTGDFVGSCDLCFKSSLSLWRNFPPIFLSKNLSVSDIEKIDQIVDDQMEPKGFKYEGIDFYLFAKEIVTNNSLSESEVYVGSFELRVRNQIRNLLLIYLSYKNILAKEKPDRIISNDSHYGMWRILQELAIRDSIPFYSNYPATEIGAWCYEKDRPAINLNFARYFNAIKNFNFTEEKRQKVKDWLSNRQSGKSMYFNTSSVKTKDLTQLLNVIKGRPTAVLYLNVSWDLAALNKQIVFNDQYDLVKETVKWFQDRPQYCLIIKSHPAENSKILPATAQGLKEMLEQTGFELNENIVPLYPSAEVSSYDLIELAQAGIVHTSTIALEIAQSGKAVITTADSHYRSFGVTIDPLSRAEYFDKLSAILNGAETFRPDLELVHRFLYFYFFEYFMRTNLIKSKIGHPTKLNYRQVMNFSEGTLKNVVNSVEKGKEIHQAWL